jgi:4-amino-4-deoxy-L-arabinose transferase-like glycosyltransferase
MGWLKIFRSKSLLILVALGIRLLLAAHLPSFLSTGGNPFRGNEPSHIAAHVAQGEGFSSPYDGIPILPTAQQPPIYPLVLAIIFKVFGVYSHSSLLTILLVNAVAGSVICLLIYYVGQSYFSETAALIAAWLWALVPSIAATDLFIANYTLSTCFVLGWLLVLPGLTDSRRDGMILGLASGVAALLNPMLLLVIPASYRWLLDKTSQLLWMVLAIVVIVSPWMIRNHIVLGHVYPGLRDNFGFELYIGNHPGMDDVRPRHCAWDLCDGTYDYEHADVPTGNRRFAEIGEPAFMTEKKAEAIAYIRSQPVKFLGRTARRVGAFWLLPYPFFYLSVLILSVAGAALAPRSLRAFIAFMFLVYPVAFYLTQTTWASSYRHPIEPLMLLGSAYALERGWAGLHIRVFARVNTPGVTRSAQPSQLTAVGEVL